MPDALERRRRLVAAAWSEAVGTKTPDLAPVPGGSESAPWRVVGPAGRFVLRRYGPGADAAERATVALAAAGAAWRQGLAAPRPVPTDAGQAFLAEDEGTGGGVWALVRWVPGRARRTWLDLSADEAGALGAALARLHAALKSLPPDLGGAGDGPGIPRHGLSRDQILHGDPSQGNVLWLGRGPGARVGFVDFDRVHRGPVERDLGRVLVGMAPWAGAGSTLAFPAFLAGYAAVAGRPNGARLRQSIPQALAEGEAWIGRADLSARARRAARRWLVRARAVELEPEAVAWPVGHRAPANRPSR